ncbi:unnamed protein product [Fructobacillus cardui]|uniref:Uncharacterized protein n=1 Tax=Fructobacillus cardui TaxID=2893170 RepID=A0ABN9YWL0_9LACO|nr:unnamed protein product [Fructobacillus cardui]CAK1243784.1 unnamed protein product [Fructobacillus cardui]CAK1245794.1 unnamed protein product [Fructobacillus cardui]
MKDDDKYYSRFLIELIVVVAVMLISAVFFALALATYWF